MAAPPGWEPIGKDAASPPGWEPAKPEAAGPSKQAGLDWGALPTTGDVIKHGGGAILDTMGLGRAGARTSKGVVLNPQGVDEHLASLGVTVPAYYAMRGGPGGRVALGGAQGAAAGHDRGEDASGIAMSAGIDAATAGLFEAGGAVVRKGLGKLAKPARDAVTETTKRATEATAENATRARGFDYATRAPQEALDAIRQRIPAGAKISVPSIMGKGEVRITPDEAMRRVSKLEGADYQQAVAEISNAFNLLDKGAKGAARLGSDWYRRVSPERFTPKTAVPEAVPPASRGARSADVAERMAGKAQPAATAAEEDPVEHSGGMPRGFPTMGILPWLGRHIGIPGVHLPVGGGGH